jgi:asparagine synthase (glutamine-hydrolysing)
MCGIVGIWEFDGVVDKILLESMRDTLAHRGPDDEGVYVDDSGCVGLGHRRLTILDLTAAGHQPMSYEGVWTVHNGEIYNFRGLRKQLTGTGHSFESESDTEVILKGFREWGLDVVQRFRGMFATALWDSAERKLHLARDRAGVKPLYYYSDNDRFIFASEMRAILRHPAVSRDLDLDALALYLKLGYVPAPHSIFRNVSKLEAGHTLTVDEDGRRESLKYWDVFDCFRRGVDEGLDEEEATGELERILTDSFRLRTVSDVPVGVFLSGGIDSTTVAALLQKDSTRPVKTFTIGFEDEAYDEAETARKVAARLGTDHHELYLDPRMALEIIPSLPEIYDEPFGDASGIPTYMVSRFARESVKVALSADGGDELFAGYRLYTRLARAYRSLSRLGPLLKPVVGAAGAFPLRQLLKGRTPTVDHTLGKLRASVSGGFSMSSFFWAGRSIWTDDEIDRLLRRDSGATVGFVAPYTEFAQEASGFVDFMRAADYRSYLADDLLVKVDRASMAVSLESRDPFLDHRIAEFAAALPERLLVRGNDAKYLLKRVLYRHVPRDIVDGPKRGFAVPLNEWLKTDLKGLLTEYLNEDRIRREGVFDWPCVREELEAFLDGRVRSSRIWLLLEYEMWRDRWLDPAKEGEN